MSKRVLCFYALCLLTGLGFLVAPYWIFFGTPLESSMGLIQKIFYFHVPCSWAMLLAALLCAVGSAAYLFAGRRWGDELGAAAAELAVVFGVLVLITGPLWAKHAWGHYWVWDSRLTTMSVLFLLFLAVLLARRYAGPASRRIAAGLSLFGAADVPLVYLSVRFWRTIHPETSVVTSLPRSMQGAFAFSLVLFTLLFTILLWIRLDLERSRQRMAELMVAVAERR